MTRRIFFGLIPALLAAAKWPLEKMRGVPHVPGVITDDGVWSRSFIAEYYVTDEMAADATMPATWVENKLRSEMHNV